MLEKKALKPGALIWWTSRGEAFQADCSCPCVVTHVDKKSFRVRSLDDFKETSDLRMDDEVDLTSRREMRPCTIAEVVEFLERRELELEQRVLAANTELQKRERERNEYADKVKKFLEESRLASL